MAWLYMEIKCLDFELVFNLTFKGALVGLLWLAHAIKPANLYMWVGHVDPGRMGYPVHSEPETNRNHADYLKITDKFRMIVKF
jgi:hypothetical protein